MAANLRLAGNSIWLNEGKKTPDPISRKNVDDLLLISTVPFKKDEDAAPSYKMLAVVISAHIALLAALLISRPDIQVVEKAMTPMMVSLVNTPSSDEAQVMPEQPAVVEMPKKQEQKVKQTRELTELPAKELAAANAIVNAPAELPAIAEAVASEKPTQAEQPVQVAEAPAKVAAVAEPALEPAVEPPRFGAAYLNNPAPKYPPVSRRFGEQGRVLLRVLVSENGLAESVQLDSSSGYEKLDRAAMEAVKKWSFIPARRSNQPVSAYVLVPVNFLLNS